MIGGLLKSTSRLAVVAAAGLFMGGVAMPSAKAADLGGDCCADLEERVAELEATTVRKGNRKVSLTLYGWVHKGIMYWNDGEQSNTYFGVDNTNFATRFGLRGDARISPDMTAGFSILMDVITGATTSGVRRDREDRSLDVNDKTGAVIGAVNSYSEDHTIRMRDANVWIESKTFGRFTLGHLTNPGPQGLIDLGGTVVASGAAIDLVGGSFQYRNSATGAVTAATIANNATNVADFSHRTDSIRWDSPTVAGFVLSAAYGEAAQVDRTVPVLDASTQAGPVGAYWAVALRYAGEFSGFRVAAAAAYESSEAEERMGSSSPLGAISESSNNTGYSASILHVASGLFAQGSYIRFERPNLDVAGVGSTDDGTLWQIQAGISQNWTGMGKTVLYGEYARGENLQRTFNTTLGAALDNEYTMWGLGVVQNIDAAAMEVYLAYRRHSLDRDAVSGADVNDIDIVIGGARIAF
jgi:hypothetical protein